MNDGVAPLIDTTLYVGNQYVAAIADAMSDSEARFTTVHYDQPKYDATVAPSISIYPDPVTEYLTVSGDMDD